MIILSLINIQLERLELTDIYYMIMEILVQITQLSRAVEYELDTIETKIWEFIHQILFTPSTG